MLNWLSHPGAPVVFLKMFIHFEREREREREKERESKPAHAHTVFGKGRERERENPKQALCHQHRAPSHGS